MISTQIKALDAQVRRHWRAKPDGKVDTWRSFLAAVEAGITTGGDCDDLSTTVLDALTRAGLALEDGWLLVVDTNNDKRGDHLVGGARDEVGGFWIVGDTLTDGVYPAHLMKHKGIAFFCLKDLKKWEGLPWERAH